MPETHMQLNPVDSPDYLYIHEHLKGHYPYFQVRTEGLYPGFFPYLVFPFEHQQICDFPERQPQTNDLSFVYVVGQLAYVDHA